MNPILMAGTSVVVIALIFYSLFIREEYKQREVSGKLLTFLSTGLFLDCTATVLMIVGSVHTPFTIHGFIGYSALAVMMTDTILVWRLKVQSGLKSKISLNLHRYSLIAYSWWVIAFISGGIIAMVL
jgi:hypothetical protein